MPINYSVVGLPAARDLLAAVATAGGAAPDELTAIVDAVDTLRGTRNPGDNPETALLKRITSGELRDPSSLDKAIRDAAIARVTDEFRAGLAQRTELSAARQFGKALKAGAADEAIDSLRKPFDAAAAALAETIERIDSSIDPVQFLATCTEADRKMWNAIDKQVDTLQRIGAVVCAFGPNSGTWPMMDVPVTLSGAGGLHDAALMCCDPSKYDVMAASAMFRQPGQATHRHSPWFRASPILRLNTIAEAAETLRQWCERAWEAQHGGTNNRQGFIDPDKGFVATPTPNPYRQMTSAKT